MQGATATLAVERQMAREIKDKSGKTETLHLNGSDEMNFELPLKPVDRDADLSFQQKFSGDMFYGSQTAIKKMTRADREAAKFNDLTEEDRLDPILNHDRITQDPNHEAAGG